MKLELMRFEDIPLEMPYIESDADPKNPGEIFRKLMCEESPTKDIPNIDPTKQPVLAVFMYMRDKSFWMKLRAKMDQHVGRKFRIIPRDALDKFKGDRKKI